MVQGTRADVERQFDRHEIDEYGLGKLDRLVVEKVFTQPKGKKVNGVFQVTHWAVAEDTLVGMIGVDRHRWRNGLALDGLALEGCFTSTKPLAPSQAASPWVSNHQERTPDHFFRPT